MPLDAVATETIRRDIYFSKTSFALLAGTGLQSELLEGLIVDIGYQMIWAPDLYPENVGEDIIHQVKFGFAFRF